MIKQLWNIANTLRRKMNANDFRDYILDFIFHKFLSRKMDLYTNEILKPDKLTFHLAEGKEKETELLEAIKDVNLYKLSYFLKPSELFSELTKIENLC